MAETHLHVYLIPADKVDNFYELGSHQIKALCYVKKVGRVLTLQQFEQEFNQDVISSGEMFIKIM